MDAVFCRLSSFYGVVFLIPDSEDLTWFTRTVLDGEYLPPPSLRCRSCILFVVNGVPALSLRLRVPSFEIEIGAPDEVSGGTWLTFFPTLRFWGDT